MSETVANAQHNCICQDIANMMRSFGPSEAVAGHFRAARIEVLKGIRQMIDDRIEQTQKTDAKGTSFGVE